MALFILRYSRTIIQRISILAISFWCFRVYGQFRSIWWYWLYQYWNLFL